MTKPNQLEKCVWWMSLHNTPQLKHPNRGVLICYRCNGTIKAANRLGCDAYEPHEQYTHKPKINKQQYEDGWDGDLTHQHD